MPILFRSGRRPDRKTRPTLTDLPGMARAWMPELRQRRSGCPMPGKRQAGWPSLLVTFLLATQEKSDSVAEGDRPLLPLNATRAKASRASALLRERALLACRVQSLPQTRGLKCDACLRRHDGCEGAWCRCGGPDGSRRVRPAPATATPPAPLHNSTAHPPRAPPRCTGAPWCGWRR